jgi:hypothetical protein
MQNILELNVTKQQKIIPSLDNVLFIETPKKLEEVGAQDPGYLFIGYVKVPLLDEYRLEGNSKKHDLQSLQDSFYRHGFKVSLIYDPLLPNISGGVGAVQCGNGRVEDLLYIYANRVNLEVPKGIIVKDDEWYAPVSFGVNDKNQEEAIAFSIHENIANMLGGDGITFLDMSRVFDTKALAEQLGGLAEEAIELLPIGIDFEDYETFLKFGKDDYKDEEGTNDDPPDNSKDEKESRFGVIVFCDDEDEQNNLIDALVAEGKRCKVLA